MKNIFITGGSKGIGKELVRAFTGKGHRVFFTYQYSVAGAEALVAALKAEGFDHAVGIAITRPLRARLPRQQKADHRKPENKRQRDEAQATQRE